MELSTPVVTLWDGVLALPLIGTLDSARTQVVMESLLQRIVETGAAHRDHRHHRRADRRHAHRAAPAQDRGGGAADGRRLHHQRHPPADRPDDRAPRRGPRRRSMTKATLADAFAVALQAARARRHESRRRPRRRDATIASSAGSRPRTRTDVERIPILKMGEYLLVTIQVDMHDRLAMTLQDDLTSRIVASARARRADRHLGARDGRLVHRPHARQHRGDVARARRRDGRRRHAAGGRDHAGRARAVADGRAHGAQHRAGHGAAAQPRSTARGREDDGPR